MSVAEASWGQQHKTLIAPGSLSCLESVRSGPGSTINLCHQLPLETVTIMTPFIIRAQSSGPWSTSHQHNWTSLVPAPVLRSAPVANLLHRPTSPPSPLQLLLQTLVSHQPSLPSSHSSILYTNPWIIRNAGNRWSLCNMTIISTSFWQILNNISNIPQRLRDGAWVPTNNACFVPLNISNLKCFVKVCKANADNSLICLPSFSSPNLSQHC